MEVMERVIHAVECIIIMLRFIEIIRLISVGYLIESETVLWYIT